MLTSKIPRNRRKFCSRPKKNGNATFIASAKSGRKCLSLFLPLPRPRPYPILENLQDLCLPWKEIEIRRGHYLHGDGFFDSASSEKAHVCLYFQLGF